MADYLFRRPNSLANAPWRWFVPQVPPADVVQPEEQIERVAYEDRAPGYLRAAFSAYMIFNPVPPPAAEGPQATAVQSISQPAFRVTTQHASYRFFAIKSGGDDVAATTEEQIERTVYEDRASGYLRAGFSAYEILNPVPIQSEPQATAVQWLPPFARGAPWAGTEAYSVFGIPKPLLPDEPNPSTFPHLPIRAPGSPRASPEAYDLISRFVVQDEPQATTVQQIPSRAPGPVRTAATAYDVTTRFGLPDDVPILHEVMLPDVAMGWPRAQVDAYLTLARFVIQDEPQVAQIQIIPSVAPAAQRTAATGYDVAAKVPPPDEPQLAEIQLEPSLAPGPLRTSVAAYDVAAKQPPPDEPTAVQFMVAAAPAAQRTANTAYVVTATFPPAELGESPAVEQRLPLVSQPLAAAVHQQRSFTATFTVPDEQLFRQVTAGPSPTILAAATAYDVLLRPPIPDEPSATIGLSLPQSAIGAPRSVASAYLVAVSPPIQSEPQLGIGLSLPAIARGLARASEYVTASQFVVQDETTQAEDVLMPERATGYPLATRTAYFVSLRPQVPDEPQATAVQQIPASARGPSQAATYELLSMYPPPSEPGLGIVSWPDRGLLASRAASSAYTLTVQFAVPELAETPPLELRTVLMPSIATGTQRAGSYELLSKFVIGDEPPVTVGLSLPGRADGSMRSQYVLSLAPQIPDEPFAALQLPSVASAAARAADYWIHASFVIQDETSQAEDVLLPSRAYVAARAASYDILVGPPIQSEPQAGIGLAMPSFAPAADRSQYSLAASFVVQDEPSTTIGLAIPSRASGPLRAVEYATESRFVIADDPPLSIGVSLPSTARGSARAAVYEVWATFPPADEPQTGTTVAVPQFARAPIRAAESAYSVAVVPAVPELAAFIVTEQIGQPFFTVTSQYPAYRYFAIKSGGDDAPVPEEQIERTSYEDRAAGYLRAAADAYTIGGVPLALLVDQPFGMIGVNLPNSAIGRSQHVVSISPQLADDTQATQLLPSVAITASRAADYWLHASFVVQDETTQAEDVLLPSRTYSQARASDYGIFVTPPIQSEPQRGIGLSIPAIALTAPRAVDYVTLSRFVVQDEPAASEYESIPAIAIGSLRAASQAYLVSLRPALSDEPLATIGLQIPSRAPGAMRAAEYVTASRFVLGDEPQTIAVQMIPQVRAVRRTAGFEGTFHFVMPAAFGPLCFDAVQVSLPWVEAVEASIPFVEAAQVAVQFIAAADAVVPFVEIAQAAVPFIEEVQVSCK